MLFSQVTPIESGIWGKNWSLVTVIPYISHLVPFAFHSQLKNGIILDEETKLKTWEVTLLALVTQAVGEAGPEMRPSSTWHHNKPRLHEDLLPSLHSPGEAPLDLPCQFIWLLQVAHWIGIWLWPCSGLSKEQIVDSPPLRKEGVLFALCIWQAHLIPWSLCHTEGEHLAGLGLGSGITSFTDLPLEMF